MTMSRGGASLDQLANVAAMIAPLNWHIELHVASAITRAMMKELLQLPVPIVLDHLGQVAGNVPLDHPDVDAMLRLLQSGRVWVKVTFYRYSLAGPPYEDMRPLFQRVVAEAPERCLWGSDWPHPNIRGYMPDDGELVDIFASWIPEAATRKRILVDNPAALYFHQ